MMRQGGIKCVLYSLGYGVYLVDPTEDETPEAVTDHIKDYGLDVVETIPNPRRSDQIFIVTKHGRPPCALEKNQVSSLILSDLDAAIKEHDYHYLPKRLMMLKREFAPKINLIQ